MSVQTTEVLGNVLATLVEKLIKLILLLFEFATFIGYGTLVVTILL